MNNAEFKQAILEIFLSALSHEKLTERQTRAIENLAQILSIQPYRVGLAKVLSNTKKLYNSPNGISELLHLDS